MPFEVSQKSKSATSKSTSKNSSRSKPIAAPAARRQVARGPPEDSDDDEFEPYGQDSMGMPPVREAGQRAPVRQKALGNPITEDPITRGLNEYERDILNRFYEKARRKRDEVQ
jgi:hypothetical protein